MMRPLFKMILGTLLTAVFSASARANARVGATPELEVDLLGAVSGGGGRGIVCRNTDGTVKSIEILDLWEARELHGLKLIEATGTADEAVATMLERLKNSYPFWGSGDMGDGPLRGQEFILARLKQVAARFLKADASDRRVVRLRGAILKDTPDSPEKAWPRVPGCGLEQIVNYQRGEHILINQDLYEKLDLTNQSALIAHEALYSLLRDNAKETNSLRTRRAVGYAAAGYFFPQPVKPELSKRAITCVAEPDPYGPKARIHISPEKREGDLQMLNIYFDRVGDSELMGRRELVHQVGIPVESAKMILQGSCSRASKDYGFDFGLEFDGPVEFDREVHLQWVCHERQLKFRMTHAKPGIDEVETYYLKCAKSQQ